MEGKGLPCYWCHCRRRRRLDCSQPFPSFLHPLDKFLMTLDSNNTSIPGSGISSQLALERRFHFAIRLEQIVQAVALYGRRAFSASIAQTWWLHISHVVQLDSSALLLPSTTSSTIRYMVRCSIKTPCQIFRNHSLGCFSLSGTSQADMSYCMSSAFRKSRTS